MEIVNHFFSTATIDEVKKFLASIEEHRNTVNHRVVELVESIIREYEKLLSGTR